MKQFFGAIFVAALLGVAFAECPEPTPQLNAVIRHDIEECRKDIIISDQEIENMFALNILFATESMECLARCIYQRHGVFDGDKFMPAIAAQKAREYIKDLSAVPNLVDRCNALTGSNSCNQAFKIFICYYSRGEVEA